MKTETTRGFTLVELLLVIAVIGLLAGLLFNAVFGVTRQANRTKNKSNGRLLHAAIMEYRHDTGKWPVPPGAAENVKPEVKERKITGGKNKQKNVEWKLVFGEVGPNGEIVGQNNDPVVYYLLNGPEEETETEKRYLDLRPFSTTENGDEKNYLSDETAETMSAFDAWRNGGAARSEGKNLPLVYRDSFIRCPVCNTICFADAARCRNEDDCKDPETDGVHVFSTDERKKNTIKGTLPYKITFDLINNTCSVEGVDK